MLLQTTQALGYSLYMSQTTRPAAAKTLELHTHSFTSGPRSRGSYANGFVTKFSHSHADGHRAHCHADTGPSSYTIDKDDWFRSTGLRGGGRKTFTVNPKGEQFPIEELEDWQKSFQVIICNPTPSKGQPGYMGDGPGEALPLRLMLGFGIACIVTDGSAVG